MGLPIDRMLHYVFSFSFFSSLRKFTNYSFAKKTPCRPRPSGQPPLEWYVLKWMFHVTECIIRNMHIGRISSVIDYNFMLEVCLCALNFACSSYIQIWIFIVCWCCAHADSFLKTLLWFLSWVVRVFPIFTSFCTVHTCIMWNLEGDLGLSDCIVSHNQLLIHSKRDNASLTGSLVLENLTFDQLHWVIRVTEAVNCGSFSWLSDFRRVFRVMLQIRSINRWMEGEGMNFIGFCVAYLGWCWREWCHIPWCISCSS